MGTSIATDLTLPIVVTSALIDSVNPCAFAVLLTFVATTLVLAERTGLQSIGGRAMLWRMGAFYIAGIFVTYLGLGLGALTFASALGQTHWIGRAAAFGAIILGVLALQEALVPEWGSRLTVPAALHHRLRRLTERTSMPAVFAAGVLIGLCTIPCSGAIYLAVIGLLATTATYTTGVAYLALYNIIIVLPLVALLGIAGSRPTLNLIARWQLHHRQAVKFGLAALSMALGLMLLVTL